MPELFTPIAHMGHQPLQESAWCLSQPDVVTLSSEPVRPLLGEGLTGATLLELTPQTL